MSELQRLIDLTLAERSYRLRFPPLLEARYEKDTEAARRRSLKQALLASLVVYASFEFDLWYIAPDIRHWDPFVRLGISAVLLAGALVQSFRLSAWIRETIPFGVAVLVALHIGAQVLGSHSAAGIHILYTFPLLIVFTNLFGQLIFPFSVALSALVGVIFLFVLHALKEISWAEQLNAGLVMLSTIGITLLGNYRLERQQRQTYLLSLQETLRREALSKVNRRLRQLTFSDYLTDLANRRRLEQVLEEVWRAPNGNSQPLGILMVDVDHFKAFNDRYGHLSGDACLQTVAKILRAHMRSGVDVVARYGGEEFVVVMPDQTLLSTVRTGERIRLAVEDAALPHEVSPYQVVTVSIGVASASIADIANPETLIAQADAALYAAKEAGRNRVFPPLSSVIEPTQEIYSNK
ncbi:MAG: diguanylate cyclase [Acidobacteriia bacterium]|nr:diguanylate cyclase [Methyloceanibacter sp.]MCL6493004.1 diguanylate cyclase [Terriglobia bacterium]